MQFHSPSSVPEMIGHSKGVGYSSGKPLNSWGAFGKAPQGLGVKEQRPLGGPPLLQMNTPSFTVQRETSQNLGVLASASHPLAFFLILLASFLSHSTHALFRPWTVVGSCPAQESFLSEPNCFSSGLPSPTA